MYNGTPTPGKKIPEEGVNSSQQTPVSKNASSFTRFLTQLFFVKSKKSISPGRKKITRIIDSLTTSKDSPGDTGEVRLSRILAEAAEEASTQVQSGFEGATGANLIQGSSNTFTSKRSCRTIAEAKTPSKRAYIEEDSDEESEESEASTDSSFSVELLPNEEDESPKAKPVKRKKQQEETSAPKRAKPRHLLAGWMYHQYPILKFFATAPADSARYPLKYRCRV